MSRPIFSVSKFEGQILVRYAIFDDGTQKTTEGSAAVSIESFENALDLVMAGDKGRVSINQSWLKFTPVAGKPELVSIEGSLTVIRDESIEFNLRFPLSELERVCE